MAPVLRQLRRLTHPAYLAQIVSVVGSASLTLASTWLLAPSDRGRLATAVVLMTLGSYAVSLGLPSEMLQRGARRAQREAIQILYFFSPLCGLLVLVIGLVCIATEAFPYIGLYTLIGIMMGTYSSYFFNMLSWYDYGRGRFARTTVLRGLIPTCSFIIMTWSIETGVEDPVTVAVYSYSAAMFISVVVLIIRTHVQPRPRPLPDRFVPAEVLLRGLSYFLPQSGMLLWIRMPVLVCSLIVRPQVVALVSLGTSIAEFQNYLPQMRAAITFREAAGSSAPRLTRTQLSEALLAMVPGTAAAAAAALLIRVTLPTNYQSLPGYVLTIGPGVAALAVASSALSVLSTQHRNVGAGLVLLGALAPIAAAFYFSMPTHPQVAMLFWSFGAWVVLVLLILRAKQEIGVWSR